jgi:hypothetical protein
MRLMVSYPLLGVSLLWLVVGLGFIYRPQTMFRIRFAPVASGDDGLTNSGEQSYRYFGMVNLLFAFAFFLFSLTI